MPVPQPTREPTRVLVLAIDELAGPELIGEIHRHLKVEAPAAEVMVVAPSVEKTAFRHALGDVDAASADAERRLETSIDELSRVGISAHGGVGDSDPLIAAEDCLQEFRADEVLIVAHAADQARWFETGLFERAQESLDPPLHLVAVRNDEIDSELHLAGIEEAGPGRKQPPGADRELVLSENLPRFTRGDLIGMVMAVIGTLVAIVLAATGPGADSGGGAAQILIAMGVALVNMAHVVGLLLLESVHYRGGWQHFFRNLSIVATPSAIVANGLITLLA